MKKILIALIGLFTTTITLAAEVPLCALPLANSNTVVDNAAIEGDPDPGCAQIITGAKQIAATAKSTTSFNNSVVIPPQLSVGAVYLQPITMAPAGMMRPRAQSDIHLEIDIHAKEKLPSRGFAPGDWLPNVDVNYSIQKVGDAQALACGVDKNGKPATVCNLMAMVASDGAHYGDNVKLAGPGFYIVTFNAHTDPNFGWHTDTDSKILGTEFVQWNFKQSYLFKWTGIGKKGGY
jgi:periplasmic iron binding protein